MSASADVLAALQAKFPAAIPRASSDHPAFNVPADQAFAVLAHLRDAGSYDLLVDVTAIDAGADASPRFTVVWHLLSTTQHGYVRLAAVCLDDAAPKMASAVSLWPGANWHEREAYDMFGIVFEGHPDLRRILMWDGYPYHPLRKDFPLAGIEVPLHDAEVGTITGATAKAVPMMGGPFVAGSGGMNLTEIEPRAKDESWSERHEKPE